MRGCRAQASLLADCLDEIILNSFISFNDIREDCFLTGKTLNQMSWSDCANIHSIMEGYPFILVSILGIT